MPNILITLEGTSFTNSANINGHEQALIVFITANLYGRLAEFYTFSYQPCCCILLFKNKNLNEKMYGAIVLMLN